MKAVITPQKTISIAPDPRGHFTVGPDMTPHEAEALADSLRDQAKALRAQARKERGFRPFYDK